VPWRVLNSVAAARRAMGSPVAAARLPRGSPGRQGSPLAGKARSRRCPTRKNTNRQGVSQTAKGARSRGIVGTVTTGSSGAPRRAVSLPGVVVESLSAPRCCSFEWSGKSGRQRPNWCRREDNANAVGVLRSNNPCRAVSLLAEQTISRHIRLNRNCCGPGNDVAEIFSSWRVGLPYHRAPVFSGRTGQCNSGLGCYCVRLRSRVG